MTARRVVIAQVLNDWDSYDDETRRLAGPLPDLIDDALTLNGHDLPLLNGHVFRDERVADREARRWVRRWWRERRRQARVRRREFERRYPRST